jgi:hypothetical protein
MELTIYLDFNATTPVAEEVIEAVQPFLFAASGNPRAFSKDAADGLEVANGFDVKRAKQRFILAYEGFYALVQAVLELNAVRTKEARRNLAIQRVAADLHFNPGEMKLVIDAHARRSDTTYRSPFPPISRAEAQAMIDILAKSLPLARTLTGVPSPTRPTRVRGALS